MTWLASFSTVIAAWAVTMGNQQIGVAIAAFLHIGHLISFIVLKCETLTLLLMECNVKTRCV